MIALRFAPGRGASSVGTAVRPGGEAMHRLTVSERLLAVALLPVLAFAGREFLPPGVGDGLSRWILIAVIAAVSCGIALLVARSIAAPVTHATAMIAACAGAPEQPEARGESLRLSGVVDRLWLLHS